MITKKEPTSIVICVFIILSFFYGNKLLAGTLSCTVRASACSGGETAIWRMSGTSNAHAELSSQSNYAQLVCCGGVSGLGNSCSGTFATALKLSGTTNAHAEQNSQSNYANSACLSVPSGGSVSVGYQASNCIGFDTTLGSMSGTTNAHTGDGSAYTTKICATATGPSGTLAVDIVDAGGNPVTSPSVSFGAVGFSFDGQTSNGTLGISSQKIRLSNTTATPAWTLTIAATSGPTALWTTGSITYDFNSTAANGRLTIDPSGATIAPQGGCTSTGLSLGSSTAFNQGVTDSVTVVSASGSTQTGCYWDFTGISLAQDIPAAQDPETYTISMTLTAV